MKKFFSLLSVLFLMGSFITSCTSDVFDESSDFTNVDESQQVDAREIGNKLLESFGMTSTRSLSDSEYPDYYGGGYIKNGKFHVFVVGDFLQNKSLLARSIGNYSNLVYVKGNYSYSELKGILSTISNFINDNKDSDIAKNIRYYRLNDFENNVSVELEECTNENIESFKANVVNSPAIIFKKYEREYQMHNTLSPGSTIVKNIDGSFYPGSVGYRAIRFGNVGFVTAGHVYATNEDVYNLDREVIGYCQYSIKANSTDAAFVVITDFSYTIDNGSLEGEEYNIWAGDYVTKLGQTIPISEGYITSTSTSVNASGVLLTDLAEATYLSANGDSGGAVYLSGNNKVVGIHQGSTNFTALFTKLSNISPVLNVTFY